MKRRRFLASPLAWFAAGAGAAASAQEDYPRVAQGRTLVFPRDHGAHPAFRTEWWYLTGWLRAGGRDLGFQITFFRSRPRIGEDNPSRFAPAQLLFAHAALSDRESGKLIHDQHAARSGFGLARALESDTDVRIDDWSLERAGGAYVARIPARDFEFALEFTPTQAVLLQGAQGYSRKGPSPVQASFYYSWPQLRVSGTLAARGKKFRVEGLAWLDHEWASQPLAGEAIGWDWAGINGADGSALMVFRIRDRHGGSYWAGGSTRSADGRLRVLQRAELSFEPLRRWRSPRTGVEYPTAMRIGAGGMAVELEPLMEDQELDARASTGTIYWEGAVRASAAGKSFGRGYLELTGYWKPLKL